MIGSLEELTEDWRVGDKLLHEIGLPGRYNDLGKWQPLVFPGDVDARLAHVRTLSDDPDIQGGLLYMHCTGHRVFEFAAIMEAELPATIVTAGGRFHLYKCNPSSDSAPAPTHFIYDGWVDLSDSSPEAVAVAIQDVTRLMNRTALAIDGPVVWRPKYTLRGSGRSVWPGERIAELNAIFAAYPTGANEEAIDAAVDWYNRGAGSGNPFTAFLCFYIGIESLTHAVFDGDATLGLELSAERPSEASQRRDKIADLLAELYETDPEEFVRRAYFDVIVGSTERTRRLIGAVFGADSGEYELLFAKRPDTSLTDIRSRLAHGLASDLAPAEARAIRERVGEVRGICRDLILRLLLQVHPGDPVPGFQRVVTMSFSDPRSVDIATSLSGLPEQDWAIREDWVAWD